VVSQRAEESRSRLEILKAEQKDPQLPEVSLAYLVDCLMEAGPISAMGFGGPLAWPEIESWERGSEKPLHPWERIMLRRLSAEWVREARRAEAAAAEPPFKGATFMTPERRAAVSRRIDELLGAAPA
jgi:hypothetical protein